jgi:hypothetical protein
MKVHFHVGHLSSHRRSHPRPRPQFLVMEKTTLCRFYASGSCRKGRDCTFAHGLVNLRHKIRESMTMRAPSGFIKDLRSGLWSRVDSCNARDGQVVQPPR